MLRGSLLRTAATLSRSKNSRGLASIPPKVVIFLDDQMAVCWHKEETFPYEFSKPLPQPKPEPYSVLKINPDDAMKTFAKKLRGRPLAEECAKITYTTMHRWFPRPRDKKAKNTSPDRPYL